MTTTRPYVAARIAHSQRLARETACPKCRAAVLVGPDYDDVSYVACVDATPVDPKHETWALGHGYQTYDLDHGKLYHRQPWHYGSHEFPMHVSHVCR
jgi:hypothetical protein